MATVDLSKVDDNVLNEDDFKDISKEISSLQAEFYSVGRELGIRAMNLDTIKLDSSLSHRQKLDQVILLWLREDYNVKRFGKPTWRGLVKAVNAIRPALAKTIMRNLQDGDVITAQQNEGLSEQDSLESRLDVSDLIKVYKAMKPGRAKWFFIGLELGLIASDLDSIKSQFLGNPEDCLRETLKKFLEKKDPKPTWTLVIKALESDSVELGAEAEKLRLSLQ